MLLGELEPLPVQRIDVSWNVDICASNLSSRQPWLTAEFIRNCPTSEELNSHSKYLHKMNAFGRERIAYNFAERSTREDLLPRGYVRY